MRLARRLLLAVLILLVAADLLLLVSGRTVLVSAYDEQMVTHQGDVILAASPERHGPGYSAPFAITTCVYWTGLKVSRLLLVGGGQCTWLGR